MKGARPSKGSPYGGFNLLTAVTMKIAAPHPSPSFPRRACPRGGGGGNPSFSISRHTGLGPTLPMHLLDTPKNACAILPTSASFSHAPTGQSDTGQRDMAPNPRAQGPGLTPPRWTRARDVALIVTLPGPSGPAKPDPHLDNRISGAAQHRAAGCPWHSRCHYPRSHSALGTVVAETAGNSPPWP